MANKRVQNNSYIVNTGKCEHRITARNYNEAQNTAKKIFGTNCTVTRIFRNHEESLFGKTKRVR